MVTDGQTPHTDPDSDHRLCGICPALRYPREQFVIYDRPCREAPFDPADGHRYTLAGEPACVHPHKIGTPPDRFAPPPGPPPKSPAPPRPRRWWWPGAGRW
ncbi:hypothetical protein [Streptomyces sp. NBC_01244]|uniref:hypothetical protein n=1 Tax=Streptomyces sp. NBC_01244 TaxID=2903797 RepID=UPI002E0D8C3A|nr:hypothetical protein OG247_43795 [Streptomyces sp. NBC_01244]